MRQTDGSEEGFSTIEVIVALTVLSVGILPLMQTQYEIQQMSRRIHQVSLENRAMTQSLRYLRDINPGVEPNGVWRFEGGQLSWTSELLADDTEFVFQEAVRQTMLGYYSVELTVTLDNGTQLSETLNRVGMSDPDGDLGNVTF